MKFDYGKAFKGRVFSIDELEKITDTVFGTTEYDLAVLRLADQIKKDLINEQDICVFTKMDGGKLRVLTDNQAVSYVDRRHNIHVKGMVRNQNQSKRIDERNLDAMKKMRYMKQLSQRSIVVQAMLRAHKDNNIPFPETKKSDRWTVFHIERQAQVEENGE